MLPPIIISVTQVPPDRYIVGNRAKIFPSFSPTQHLINSVRHNTSSHATCFLGLDHHRVARGIVMLTKGSHRETKIAAIAHARDRFMKLDE